MFCFWFSSMCIRYSRNMELKSKGLTVTRYVEKNKNKIVAPVNICQFRNRAFFRIASVEVARSALNINPMPTDPKAENSAYIAICANQYEFAHS